MEKNNRLVELGKRIREVRQSKKMSQDELARFCGYNSRSSINKIEAGLNDIPQSKIKAIADALNVSPAWLMGYDVDMKPAAFEPLPIPHMVKIPILGTVVAGEPLMSEENILGYEEIPEKLARIGDMFGLYVRGDSMTPTMQDGDVIIVHHQTYANSGDIAVVLVNGDEATVKEIKISDDGITLIGHNATVFPPRFYTAKEAEFMPVTICGVVYSVHRNLKKF